MPESPAMQQARETMSRFPKHPALTIAKKLYSEYPSLYKDVEHARTCIRTVIGSKGAKHRKEYVNKAQFRAPRKAGENPFNLPDSVPLTYEPFIIKGRDFGRIGIINDVHIPYHHQTAVTNTIPPLNSCP